MEKKFIDLHCHSILKPYSKSFKKKYTNYSNSSNPKDESSVWHQDLPTKHDELLNGRLTVTKFRQSDFTTSIQGGIRIMIVSIDPLEKGFVFNKRNKPINAIGKVIRNFVTGIGVERIKKMQSMKDYYADLYKSYEFLLELNGKKIQVEGENYRYKLVNSYSDIDENENNIIHIIISIEGGHVLNTGLELADIITDANEVLENAKKLKSKDWKYKPFYISLAHHFSNLLCGHAASFQGISKLTYNQKCDKNESISIMGRAVIDIFLKNDNGKRIYIDIKHMNPKSRLEYYNILETKYADEDIPIIVSHGALNFKNQSTKLTNDINFYNEEIVKIANSNGIFGIQLDERRLMKRATSSKKVKVSDTSNRLLRSRAGLVWRQIETIAMILYADNSYIGDPWGIQAIGSDYDGIIDPLNGYWTHKDFPLLADNLIKHADNFLEQPKAKLLPDYNQLSGEDIIEKFIYLNANNFIKKYL